MSTLSIGHGRPAEGRGRSNHPRQSSSNVFNSFEPQQIKTFKEAFNMIDDDHNGEISQQDLTKVLQQLGYNATPQMVSSYFTATGANRSINFTTFLTMFSDHLLSLDPEDEMLDAFAAFDEGDTGYISVAQMRQLLSTMGDRMSEEEISRFLSPPFADKNGNFDYREFLKVLRVTDLDQEAKAKAEADNTARD